MRALALALGLLVASAAAAQPGDVKLLRSPDALRTLIEAPEHADSVTVVHFWATWCDVCRAEMPGLSKALQKLEKDGVRVLVVSLDEPEARDHVTRIARGWGLSSATWLLDAPDPDPVVAVVDPSWDASLPATFVFRGAERSTSFVGPVKSNAALEAAVADARSGRAAEKRREAPRAR